MNNIYTKSKLFPILVILMGIFLLPEKASMAGISAEEIIKLTNIERQKNDIPQLIGNEALSSAANKKAEAIFGAQTFKHNIDKKTFSFWIKEADYDYSFVGENLAIDFSTNEGVVKAWLNSPSHKKNLLNADFSEIGVAVVNGEFRGADTTLVVQIFGAPLENFSAAGIFEEKINDSFLNKNQNNYDFDNNENLLTHAVSGDAGRNKNGHTLVILNNRKLNLGSLPSFNNVYLKALISLLLIYPLIILLHHSYIRLLNQKKQNYYSGQKEAVISENI